MERALEIAKIEKDYDKALDIVGVNLNKSNIDAKYFTGSKKYFGKNAKYRLYFDSLTWPFQPNRDIQRLKKLTLANINTKSAKAKQN